MDCFQVRVQKFSRLFSRGQLQRGVRREAAEEVVDRRDDLLNIAVEPVGQHLLFEPPPDFLHGILAMARVLRQEAQLHGGVRGAPRPDQLDRVDARVICQCSCDSP